MTLLAIVAALALWTALSVPVAVAVGRSLAARRDPLGRVPAGTDQIAA